MAARAPMTFPHTSPLAARPAPEGPHGPDQFIAWPLTQFFLRNHKNGLASMEPLHHQLDRFFFHFIRRHDLLLSSYRSYAERPSFH
jgi:hypothetical protein